MQPTLNSTSVDKVPMDSPPHISPFMSWGIVGMVLITVLATIWYANTALVEETSRITDIPHAVRSERFEYVWIELQFSNGVKRLFRGDLRPGQSYPFMEGLEAISRKGNFSVSTRGDQIEIINGIGEKSEGDWEIYRNGEKLSDSFQDISLEGGDNYVIKNTLESE